MNRGLALPESPRQQLVDDCIRRACSALCVDPVELCKTRLTRAATTARCLAIALAKHRASAWSTHELAKAFGLDQSTCYHALRRAEREFSREFELLKEASS